MSGPPEFLYKYRSFPKDKDDEERLRKTIVESLVYLPSPSDINDPFDCKIKMIVDPRHGKLRQRLNSSISNPRLGLSSRQQKQLRSSLKRSLRNPKKREALSRKLTNIEELTDKWGVLCLTEKNDDLLMWSHYSNGHRGFCLEYRRSDFFEHAIKVEYSANYPEIDAVNSSPEEQVKAILLTKAGCWQYEQEWRILESGRARTTIEFPPLLLTRVLLGAQISRDDEEELRDWVSRRPTKTPLLRAKLKDREYGLRFLDA